MPDARLEAIEAAARTDPEGRRRAVGGPRREERLDEVVTDRAVPGVVALPPRSVPMRQPPVARADPDFRAAARGRRDREGEDVVVAESARRRVVSNPSTFGEAQRAASVRAEPDRFATRARRLDRERGDGDPRRSGDRGEGAPVTATHADQSLVARPEPDRPPSLLGARLEHPVDGARGERVPQLQSLLAIFAPAEDAAAVRGDPERALVERGGEIGHESQTGIVPQIDGLPASTYESEDAVAVGTDPELGQSGAVDAPSEAAHALARRTLGHLEALFGVEPPGDAGAGRDPELGAHRAAERQQVPDARRGQAGLDSIALESSTREAGEAAVVRADPELLSRRAAAGEQDVDPRIRQSGILPEDLPVAAAEAREPRALGAEPERAVRRLGDRPDEVRGGARRQVDRGPGGAVVVGRAVLRAGPEPTVLSDEQRVDGAVRKVARFDEDVASGLPDVPCAVERNASGRRAGERERRRDQGGSPAESTRASPSPVRRMGKRLPRSGPESNSGSGSRALEKRRKKASVELRSSSERSRPTSTARRSATSTT